MPHATAAGMKLLNVGCGDTFDPTWVNVDLVARDGVTAIDLRRRLPFDDATFDGCYASHVLEHLDPAEGERLVQELHRLLRSGGVVRLVVPDLEAIAREYLAALGRARAGDARGYDWAVVELLDQLVRTRSGGRMAELMRDPALRQIVVGRVGDEALATRAPSRPPLRSIVNAVRLRAAGAIASAIGGRAAGGAFTEARFRASGENHRWMYDSYSLGRLLKNAGFVDVRAVRFDESALPVAALDGRDGKPRKPDSLYMEARK